MFLGHYAVALAAKRAAPRTSLGTLFFAAQFLDLLWPVLLLAGVEHVRIAPGITRFTPLDFYDYPISHSLAAALVWSLVVGGGYFALRRDRRAAAIVGALVASHWLLDLVMHRPDLPLLPGGDVKTVGLGLWRSVPLTLALELGLFAAGVAIYLRATARAGSIGLWAMLALLVAAYLGAAFGPPPPSESALAVSALALWLLLPFAYFVDRRRAPA
ncbi:MAG TPA: hypothetical protein VFF06_28335 [Polyangia bacterium]|nr:hypothetical protein [Polyangia bacterium]